MSDGEKGRGRGKKQRSTPSYKGLKPASESASRVHSRISRSNTKCEQLLCSALIKKGLRFRTQAEDLPGRPDIVFSRERVAIFCDGDFWHGKNWSARKQRLLKGANPTYWVKKIETNMARDLRNNCLLQADGWTVERYWESEC